MRPIALKYGFRMLAGFAALFAIIHILGFSHVYHLRVLNGFIHIAFIYLAIREYYKEHHDSIHNYMQGVATGMYASIIGVTLFALAMCIFLSLDVNQTFFEMLKSQAPLPEYFTPFTASLFIFTEGIVVSLIGSYLVTRVIDNQVEKVKN